MTTVMVVDDSITARVILVELLQCYGIDVLEAEDGQEAKDLLRTTRPDLLITDIVMPRMNGYELCRWVKTELTETFPVIMCSTKNEDFDRMWGLKQGGDAYLTKPINPQEMLSTVKRLLQPQLA